ncbi:hypothetical protein HYV71_01040 [Candidatus Uhrbacteria bacterium]|nr:hypothetical protein [Candidatus Uhrbacteria bacterium]
MFLSELKYPKKSHRKEIQYPQKSKKLAEFMGIIFGDGGINNDWQLTVTVNSVADREYAKYVIQLGKELFGIEAAAKKEKKSKALVLRFSSTNLVDFLVKMGAVRGNKIEQQIDIPSWIEGRSEYKRAFVRGLVDTDGCLYTHKHSVSGNRYWNIGFCFVSYSKKLLVSVGNILAENGVQPHYAKQMRSIYLYSDKAVHSYLSVFNTSNERINGKYQMWKGARAV